MTEMRVAELWRYPVKSLAGERLEATELTMTAIPGDRIVQVRDDRVILTARTHPRLLGLRATLGSDGEPRVNGLPWMAPEVANAIRAAAGLSARLVREMEGRLGLDCYVIRSGRLAVGDRVVMLAGERGRAETPVSRSP